MSFLKNLNPYDLHKHLINEYLLKRPGDTKLLQQRDTSRDRTDLDVVRENHRFLWDGVTVDTWEKQLAKRYFDKLFKEYCICDLSRYKENRVALRWRTENEVVSGKGQFLCSNKMCNTKDVLRSWEVNFAYKEDDVKKNALVKLRLCPDCSDKLNYHSKKREVKRQKRTKGKQRNSVAMLSSTSRSPGCVRQSTSASEQDLDHNLEVKDDAGDKEEEGFITQQKGGVVEQECWTKPVEVEDKSREEEFDEYLEDLLL